MADEDQLFDVVILGGGSGGYACAFRAAELGLSVAPEEAVEASEGVTA